jgi:hypothetical protein
VLARHTPAEILDHEPAGDEMRAVIDGWPIPDVVPPTHATVLVGVRPGLCVLGPNDAQWCLADRYLNHLQRLHTGDLILVTEHGWLDLMTEFAGHRPALLPAG